MTTQNFVPYMAEAMGSTKTAAKATIDAFEVALKKYVADHCGEAVEGTDVKFKVADMNFKVSYVAPHTGRNPATGEAIEIGESRKMTVKFAPDFKDILTSK